jgi:tetratricopeptide (TPR) repeat protein
LTDEALLAKPLPSGLPGGIPRWPGLKSAAKPPGTIEEETVAAKRIPRRELKKPDEFVTLTSRSIRWCMENKGLLLRGSLAAAAVILVVAAVFVYQGYRERQARLLYNEALALEAPATGEGGSNLEATLAKLKEVRERYASTKVAPMALADLGDIYLRKENYDEAVACYQGALKGLDGRSAIYGLVLENLGTAYEAKGAWDSALETYERLGREGTPVYQRQAELGLGRVYEAKGDRAKALSHYDAYLKDNPADTLASDWIRVKVTRWRLEGVS